ncbi:chemotaxis protein CheA [Novipirellula artificiosorum]|uniref:histidine kinase n=1 Tax=Novipirellula artificiosorum TaxID=2528016 RepID=A0A5C6D9X1_9BACT|nr:chemotaxis protein CheW [Novipirellula artificiosorum]TWU32036.1 Chemotaxis protein CheA [Novipirellula artificiosorum]
MPAGVTDAATPDQVEPTDDPEPVVSPASLVPIDATGTGETHTSDKAAGKVAETMRVEIDQLDGLMNLAGELVVNRARFVQISRQISPAHRKASTLNRIRDFCDSLRHTIDGLENDTAEPCDRIALVEQLRRGLELMDEHSEIWEHDRGYLEKFGEAIDQLSWVSQSLQKGVLDTRMVPVGPLFNRFKRVVRDLSNERGKRVNLRIRGEKTELDKRMIDALGDPLVHLVRNSIDHGLESPQVRRDNDKPDVGTIFLEATHSGNNVSIHIRDDGGGIDVEKIKAKLVSNRVLSESAAGELSDEQALDYIWHPGFSTAGDDDVVTVQGKRTIDVRDEFIPLVTIDEILDWHDIDSGHDGPGGRESDGDECDAEVQASEVVILQIAGKTMGLRVDELLGSHDMVIKSLSDNFFDIRGTRTDRVKANNRRETKRWQPNAYYSSTMPCLCGNAFARLRNPPVGKSQVKRRMANRPCRFINKKNRTSSPWIS